MARREKLYGGLTRAEQIAAIERAKVERAEVERLAGSGDSAALAAAKARHRDAMGAAMGTLTPLVRSYAEKWEHRYPHASVDWFEEGVLHVVRKLPQYDPARALPSTFVMFVLGRHYCRLLKTDARRPDRRQEVSMSAICPQHDGHGEPRVLDEIPDPSTVAPNADAFDPMPIRRAVARLDNPKQRAVIRMRYGFDGDPATLEVAGRAVGVTRERARQIQQKAEQGLQHALRAFAGGEVA